MNKRIVALGVSAAVMALGAGTATAADQDLSNEQVNAVSQDLYQRSDPFQKTWQEDPKAISGADASAYSKVSVRFGEESEVEGNLKIYVDTEGGDADSSAKNVNVGSQDVDQSASQDADLSNTSGDQTATINKTRVSIDDTEIEVILGGFLR